MVSPLAATQWPVPVPPDCEVKVSVLVSETFPTSEAFPAPLVVIVGAAMVSFPGTPQAFKCFFLGIAYARFG